MAPFSMFTQGVSLGRSRGVDVPALTVISRRRRVDAGPAVAFCHRVIGQDGDVGGNGVGFAPEDIVATAVEAGAGELGRRQAVKDRPGLQVEGLEGEGVANATAHHGCRVTVAENSTTGVDVLFAGVGHGVTELVQANTNWLRMK